MVYEGGFRMDDEEIESRKRLLLFTEEDTNRLRAVSPILRPLLRQTGSDVFLKHIATFGDPASMFQSLSIEGRLEHVLDKVLTAFEEFLDGKIDRKYVERRIEIGRVHARIQLEPKWYLAALNLVQDHLAPVALAHDAFKNDPFTLFAALRSLSKMISFDMMTVLDAYAEDALVRIVRSQQEALRELSAPVIEVWDEILVIPLIGTMDTRRAQEATEAILSGVVDKRAKVVIIDITGLPVMDTSTANHLMKTVRAVELLGSRCIVTGLRAAIAQTVVSLGIDASSLTTRARLSDGLRTALEITGRRVENYDANPRSMMSAGNP